MLRTIEQRIESIVERTFGRAFRSRLQPVELARKLAREMEHHKTVSVSRVYAPNEFTVYLAPADREEFASYESSLRAELGTYLHQHAKAEGLSLVSEPAVTFETDEDLRIGEFGISCRMAEAPDPEESAPAAPAPTPPEPTSAPAPPPAPQSPLRTAPAREVGGAAAAGGASAAQTGAAAAGGAAGAAGAVAAGAAAGAAAAGVGAAGDLAAEAAGGGADDDGDDAPAGDVATEPDTPPETAPEPPPTPPPSQPTRIHEGLAAVSGTQVFSADDAQAAGLPRETLTLVMPGGRRRVTKRVTRLGRSRDCDVVVDDQNVSRRHAEIRHVGIEYVIVDLDSTNGVEVNGEMVKRHALADGDEVVLGTTTLRVELS